MLMNFSFFIFHFYQPRVDACRHCCRLSFSTRHHFHRRRRRRFDYHDYFIFHDIEIFDDERHAHAAPLCYHSRLPPMFLPIFVATTPPRTPSRYI